MKELYVAEEIQKMFIEEINKVGVRNIAYMDVPGGYQALELRMADGGLRWWQIPTGYENEFESKIRFVEDGR